MGFIVGAAFGFFTQVYSNGLRRLPLMHRPWEHVIFAGIGGLLGVKFSQWEKTQEQCLKQRLEDRGRIPIPA